MPPDQQAIAVIDVRVTNLEKTVERVTTAVESIDESLKVLTRLEERHEETRKALERAFGQIGGQEDRLRQLETTYTSATACETKMRDAGIAFDAFKKDHGDRITAVELAMPTIKLTSKWVAGGVIGIIGILAVTIANTFINYSTNAHGVVTAQERNR